MTLSAEGSPCAAASCSCRSVSPWASPRPRSRASNASPNPATRWSAGGSAQAPGWRSPTTASRTAPDYDYALTIDANASPRTYDIRGVGRSSAGWEFRGIYKVEGDTLILSYNSGTTRPTSFEADGKGSINEVYKRVR